VYEAVGMIDAMISLASYRQGLPFYTRPTFTPPTKVLRLDGVIHPLLPDPVPNSLCVSEGGVFITGSNMSGKTTFIRAVAVNAILAQTLCTCLAQRYEAPFLQVRTCIGRSDSLEEGKSYYMAEVETIGAFLASADEGPQYLFAIDEIYRGTNTTERVAAAQAVLDALNHDGLPHLVFVSTHDVELAGLLRTAWSHFHFREFVQDSELRFDYRIRPGLSSTRNALLLLQAAGYPSTVVADAQATAHEISARQVQDASSAR
ncbi:MAG: DNA mismatch repair protein MutS, partial [Armatimonadota bacterium]|nr:DNA mismatch repair protein MutS [Armatimonadota bacterium]